MNYSKDFSRNRKKNRRGGKQPRRALPVNVPKRSQKLKIQPAKNKQTGIQQISAKHVCYILLITAIGLVCFYQQSIKIYWQQTYHSDIAISSSLSLLPNDKSSDNLNDNEHIDSSLDDKLGESVEEQSETAIQSEQSVNTPLTHEDIKKKEEHKEEQKHQPADEAQVVLADQNKEAIHTTKSVHNHENHHESKLETPVIAEKPHLAEIKNETDKADEKEKEAQPLVKHEPPAPIVLTANDKVFFAGDSLMQGVAPYVKKMLFKQYKIEGIDLSKQSTGLAYPSAFDWPTKIRETLDEDPAIKLLIVFLGPNDPWDFPVKGYSKYARFKSELWEEQYRLRIENILNSAMQHNVQVLWLAAPCMRKAKLNDGMVYLNLLYQSEIEKVNQHFLPTNGLLGCTYENFSNFIANDKEKLKVRIDDGIHFTPTGQKILAKAIMEQIIVKELEDSNSD